MLLLLRGQMVDAVMLVKETHKLKGRVLFVQFLHFIAVYIQNDPIVPGIIGRDGFGHMDQVRIDEDQITLGGYKVAVVKEKETLSFQNIKDFIFIVKMLDAHIEFSVADHMLKGNSIDSVKVSNFFQKYHLFYCNICNFYKTYQLHFIMNR